MRVLRAKLSSKSGASILIALVFFLMCSMVGAVVLTAATANTGGLANLKNEQQSYFTVSSAARLLRDGLDGAAFVEITTTKDVDGTITSTDTNYDDSHSPVLEELLKEDGKAAGRREEHIFTVQAEGLDTVTVSLTMGGDYALSVSLWREDGEGGRHNPMSFTVPAEQNTHLTSSSQIYSYDTGTVDEAGQPVYSSYTETTTVKTLTVTWGRGSIAKGVHP